LSGTPESPLLLKAIDSISSLKALPCRGQKYIDLLALILASFIALSTLLNKPFAGSRWSRNVVGIVDQSHLPGF
jgi:hypothetical protein